MSNHSGHGLRIIVGGFMGLLPAGGVTWDYLQYPLGLLELGHDVYYIEDTRLWPVFQRKGGQAANLMHLHNVMNVMGMSERWAYRDEATSQWHGMPLAQIEEVIRTADLLINVSCATCIRDEYLKIPRRGLIDSDPMFTQVQYLQDRGILSDQGGIREQVDAHTHHFTFGESIGGEGCRIPDTGHHWIPTRQPICLNQWKVVPFPGPGEAAFTTVMNWSAAREMEFKGESWGQKNREFEAMIELPSRIQPIRLAIAMARRLDTPFPEEAAERSGWEVLDPEACVSDWQTYRGFIKGSLGEFSVAKNAYVKGRTGWFSCRSACYLASGRPVITQDTGWSSHLPTGAGLLGFSNLEQAVEALREVSENLLEHGKAARQLAEEFFDSRKVLGKVVEAMAS